VVLVVVFVGVLVGSFSWLWLQNEDQNPNIPSNQPQPSAPEPLLTADDLQGLVGASWTVSQTTPDPKATLCVGPAFSMPPNADRVLVRQLTSNAAQPNTLVNVVAVFPDADAATQAYALQLSQVGVCEDAPIQLLNSYNVSGLGDEAMAVTLILQYDVPEYHTLMLARTGRTTVLVDISDAKRGIPATELADPMVKALIRLCRNGGGACPTSVMVKKDVPPPGDFTGWLSEVDLPRISDGVGRWGATPPTATPRQVGSQCELTNLNKVKDATREQRTLLLMNDPNAPDGFGVDQVNYRFTTDKKATAFAKKITEEIAACAESRPTAQVDDTTKVNGVGASAKAYSGTTFLVTHKVSATQTTSFRVAVLVSSDRVSYLLANPSEDFDFTEKQWEALAARAGERVTQS
jgi:hypothetical protein